MSVAQSKLNFKSTKRASVLRRGKGSISDLSASEDVKENNEHHANGKTPRKLLGKRVQVNDEEIECRNASPPKRDRSSDDDSTPSPTQRLRDRSSDDDSTPSPTQRLSKLQISEGKSEHLAPKRLFDKGSCFRSARQALHSSVPKTMYGRESEIQELTTFLSDRVKKSSSGSLYVSGPPGTGKTACLSCILQNEEFQGCRDIYVNCTSMRSSSCIYSRITEELKLKVSKKGEKEHLQVLNKYWDTNKKATILILDEIDQLESKQQSVLYTIFEWPSLPNSKLVLIGIANSLDLTDRILPRLQAHVKLKPKLVHFAPYTKEQIVTILTERLREMDVVDVFSPVALQLLAGKVASVSGDVRRALDIGRRVLEIAEAQRESHVEPLQPTTNSAANKQTPTKKTSMSNDLKIVMDVLSSVYCTSQSLSKSTVDLKSEDAFPLQQKLLVCTLLLLLKKGKNKDASVGKLHEIYRRVCKKRNLVAINLSEFLCLCQLVETKGIVQVQKKKEARMSKIRLMWDEEEIAAALGDEHLLATVLADASVL